MKTVTFVRLTPDMPSREFVQLCAQLARVTRPMPPAMIHTLSTLTARPL